MHVGSGFANLILVFLSVDKSRTFFFPYFFSTFFICSLGGSELGIDDETSLYYLKKNLSLGLAKEMKFVHSCYRLVTDTSV